jgi:hypothetical protein
VKSDYKGMENIYKNFNQYAEIGTLDNNGFLKIRLVVGKIGVMRYELEEVNPDFKANAKVKKRGYWLQFWSPDVLFDKQSMADLAGKPIIAYSHEWLVPDKKVSGSVLFPKNADVKEASSVQVGQVAGPGEPNGEFLEADALITNQNIIDAVRDRKLVEISAAYASKVALEPGSYKNQEYDIIQMPPCTYNHIVLIGRYEGRAGSDVKILNEKNKKEKKMPEITTLGVQTTNGIVRVQTEDVATFNSFVDNAKSEKAALEKKIEAYKDVGVKTPEDVTTKIANATAEIDKLTKENAALQGKITALEADLTQAVSSENMEKLVKENEEVTAVANSMGIDWSLASVQYNMAGRTNSIQDKKELLVRASLNSKGAQIPANQIDKDGKVNNSFVDGVWEYIKMNQKPQQINAIPMNQVFNAQNQNMGVKERSHTQRLGYPQKEVKK